MRIFCWLILSLAALPSLPAWAEAGADWEEVRATPFEGRVGYTFGTFKGKLYGAGGTQTVCDCPPPTEPGTPCLDCTTTIFKDLWVTSDGETWEPVLENAPFVNSSGIGPRLIAFKDYFYALTNGFYRSSNGMDWEVITTEFETLPAPIVVWKEQLFIPSTGRYSDDMVTWHQSPQFVSNPDFYPAAAAVLGDYIYAFTSKRVWRSTTGYQWEELEGNTDTLVLGDGSVSMTSFAGHLWIGGDLGGGVARSSDGENWTRVFLEVNSLIRLPTMAVLDNALFLGGDITVSKTKVSCRELVAPLTSHTCDTWECGSIELGELLRAIQLFSLKGFQCDESGEDGYGAPPAEGEPNTTCGPHSADYSPTDWRLDLNELLRVIQLYNAGSYEPCDKGVGSEDGFCIPE